MQEKDSLAKLVVQDNTKSSKRQPHAPCWSQK
jgi:hypothetical protein